MLRIGMLLADRYEILQQIGSGGMAYVYRAKDHKLNRYVAIKVLKEEYCRDKNFVAKFRMEAQAAAGLSHANIVGVYDVGELNSVYFIVMELIEGITLKEYITRKTKLNVKEAIGVAIQVAQGLEAAHNRHLVHRDIKPQNIIISRDGKIKVTDFGIARAITDETTNMYKAAGSVHYISPEQARGGYCDERSDIYSLGITMYEMATGKVPFDGDTTVAVAIAHMNEAIVPPSQIEPSIPLALEQIILKCVQKHPENRYTNCSELISDLRQAIVTPQDSFVRFTQQDSYADITDEEYSANAQNASTVNHDTIQVMPFPQRNANKTKQSEYEDYEYEEDDDSYDDEYDDDYDDYEDYAPEEDYEDDSEYSYDEEDDYQDEYVQEVRGSYRDEYDDEDAYDNVRYQRKGIREEKEPLRKQDRPATAFDRVLVALGSILGLVILFLAVYIGVSLGGILVPGSATAATMQTTTAEQTTEEIIATVLETETQEETLSDKQTLVPDLLGLSLDEATNLLTESELQIKVSRTYAYSDEYDAGLICKQQYDEGTVVNKNTRITVTLSLGTDKFDMDAAKYIGSNISVLEYELNSYEEIILNIVSMPDETTKKDTILALEPESGLIAPGETVTAYVSEGPTKINVPDLTNLSREQAITTLQGMGLSVGSITENYNSSVDAGLVCGQSPAAWTTVNLGSSVNIVVSLGKPYYQVPSVYGMSEANARAALQAAGMTANFVWEANGSVAAGQAFAQDVAAGTWVEEGTGVTVHISTGPQTFEIDIECVKGMTQDEAIAYLSSLGLSVGNIEWKANSYVPAGYATVISTPSWTTTVSVGDSVTLYMSAGPEATSAEQTWWSPQQ